MSTHRKLVRQLTCKRRRSIYHDKASDVVIPSIIVTGAIGDITHALKQRGFIPLYSLVDPATPTTSTLVLKLSPKLYMKTAIEIGYPLLDISDSKSSHIARVQYKSLSILMRMKDELQNFDQAWLMQESKVLDRTEVHAHDDELLTEVNTYYGSKAALFFAFQFFLRHYMLVPAVAGTLLFVYQAYVGEVNTKYNPIFMLIVVLWTIIVMRLWFRKNSSLCFEWGVADADEERDIKDKAEVQNHPQRVQWWWISGLIIGHLSICLAVLKLMLYFMHWAVPPPLSRNGSVTCIDKDDCFDGHAALSLCPLIAYSILSWSAGALYNEFVALSCRSNSTSFESDRNHNIILTTFGFHFFNNNCGLMYATFYLRNLVVVQYLLASVVFTTTLLDYLLYEVYYAQHIGTDSKRHDNEMVALEGKSLLVTLSHPDADEKWKSLVMDELKRFQFRPHLQHLRLTTRYSFCCLFVVAFPITPLLMWLYSGMEPMLYMRNLKNSVRTPVDSSSLAEWLTCFKIINFVAIIVNIFLLCMMTSDLSVLVPQRYEFILESSTYRLLLMIFLEHVFVSVEIFLYYFLEVVPKGVQFRVAREKIESMNKLVHERLAMYQFIGKSEVDDKARDSAEFKVAAENLHSKYSGHFGYNPFLLLGVVISPFLCMSLGISQFLFIPICIAYFSYLKNSKDRHDIMAAAGIISDANVLRYIQQEMPSWISSSDVERAMWLDTTLQTLWPGISKSSEKVLIESVQPYLEDTTGSIIPRILIKELNLGASSPRITGVRNIKTTESMVRLDVEFVWAASPEIMLEVGKNLNLEVRKLFFSCKLRVELGPLISVSPTFGAVSLSFMGKPKIDFSFEVGGLDIMSIGIGSTDYSIAMLVGDKIKESLEFMVYPKKYIIPMVDDCDIDKLVKVIPVGILKLTIVSAKDLVIADFLAKSSDPYVVIKFMDSKFKTQTVFKNLHPIWNETFDLMVYDKETQSVLFEVFDYDFSSEITKGISSDDFLGRATLNLDRIQIAKPTEFQMRLHDTKSGSLNVICEYCPLKKNGRSTKLERKDEGKDIIFHFSPDAFMTDVLDEEPTPLYEFSDDDSSTDDEDDVQTSSHTDSGSTESGAGTVPAKKRRSSAFRKFNPFNSDRGQAAAATPRKSFSTAFISPQQSSNRKGSAPNIPSGDVLSAQRRGSTGHLQGKARKRGSSVAMTGGVLCVNNMTCRNLRKSSRNMTRALRPYIEVSVENQVKRTESKRKIKNPIFEETFNFLVANADTGTAKFKILNAFSMFDDVIIGQFSVDINEIKTEGKIDKEVILDGSTDSLFLCTLEWVDMAS